MQESQNTKLIQDAYGDFGRADVLALIARMDAGVVWQAVIGASPKLRRPA